MHLHIMQTIKLLIYGAPNAFCFLLSRTAVASESIILVYRLDFLVLVDVQRLWPPQQQQ